ncbi:MAG: methyltransferase domain-containing protein [Verrucomicrobiales bacterium]|nr:methyltransferase domain-containing protein [Verrucomicrobiales bacterium]
MKNRIGLFWILCLTLVGTSLAPAQEGSVKPGINEKFLDPKLKVTEWLNKFETESREIFTARLKILEACQIKPGDRIADVGAGTGLYTQLFSDKVGADGWVYAVDINARFLEHIQRQAKAKQRGNITTVLCPQDSIALPPNSVDLIFVCDTYHHFEFPHTTLPTIYSALRPGGSLVVIDFERIEGVSREWVVNHVRAGKPVFQKEILEAGFVLKEEVEIEELKENYFLRFTKS